VPGISQGSGGPTLVLWADPQSPAVGALNAATGSTLTTLAEQGKVTVVLRPATFLDRMGTDESTRAVAALGCASDQGKGWQFWNNLVSNQPASEGTGWTNEELATIGASAGADEAAMASCIASGQYTGWAQASNDAFLAAGIAGVPYAELSGTEVAIEDLADSARLTQLVESSS
jgi:protein-disulfide isomerase